MTKESVELRRLSLIEKRIKEIATNFCSEYPNINNCNSYEQLYAIESYLQGITEANNDCHKVINILQEKENLSDADIVEMFEKIMGE